MLSVSGVQCSTPIKGMAAAAPGSRKYWVCGGCCVPVIGLAVAILALELLSCLGGLVSASFGFVSGKLSPLQFWCSFAALLVWLTIDFLVAVALRLKRPCLMVPYLVASVATIIFWAIFFLASVCFLGYAIYVGWDCAEVAREMGEVQEIVDTFLYALSDRHCQLKGIVMVALVGLLLLLSIAFLAVMVRTCGYLKECRYSLLQHSDRLGCGSTFSNAAVLYHSSYLHCSSPKPGQLLSPSADPFYVPRMRPLSVVLSSSPKLDASSSYTFL